MHFNVALQLLLTDLLSWRKRLVSSLLDSIIWMVSSTLLIGYVLPQIGLSKTFISYHVIAMMISVSLFEIIGNISNMIADFEGDRDIDFRLTLPISSRLVFVSKIIFYTLNSMVLGLVAIPVGYLLVSDRFSLTNASLFKFILFYPSAHLLAASFTLFALCISLERFSKSSFNLARRLIDALGLLGGAQYPWYVLNNISKGFAQFVLLNPFIYAQEGLHSALLGQDQYLSFLVCLASVWFFIFVFGYFGIKKLIKRLDAI
jgi:hypothetical protein